MQQEEAKGERSIQTYNLPKKECGICHDFMVQPCSLNPHCTHRFCAECVNDMVSKLNFCPECRCDIPKGFKAEIDIFH